MKPIHPDEKYLQVTNNRRFCQGPDGYFLLLKLLMSVITAHNMMMKANKSLYVTMIPSPFCKVPERMAQPPTNSLGKHIILSKSSFPYFTISCVQFLGQVGIFVWNIDEMGGKWYYHLRGATDRRLARLTFYVTLKVTAKFARLGRLFSFAIVSA